MRMFRYLSSFFIISYLTIILNLITLIGSAGENEDATQSDSRTCQYSDMPSCCLCESIENISQGQVYKFAYKDVLLL